ncbi:hypothetical protein RFI_29705, partial [Reticulomyxa filosa]
MSLRSDNEEVYHRPLLAKFACTEADATLNAGFSPTIRATILMALFVVDMITSLIVMYIFRHFGYEAWFSVCLLILFFSLFFQFLYCCWKCNSMVHILLQYRYVGFTNLNTYVHVAQNSHLYRFRSRYSSALVTAPEGFVNCNEDEPVPDNNSTNVVTTTCDEDSESTLRQLSPQHESQQQSYNDNATNVDSDERIDKENHEIIDEKNDNDNDNKNNNDLQMEHTINTCHEGCKILSLAAIKSFLHLCHFGIIEQYIINISQFRHGLTSAFLDLCHMHCYFHSFPMAIVQCAFLFHHMLFSDNMSNKLKNKESYGVVSVLISKCHNDVTADHFYEWVYLFTFDMLLRAMPYVLWSVYIGMNSSPLQNIWSNSVFITGFVCGSLSNCCSAACHTYIWYVHHYLPRHPWNYTMKTYLWSQLLHPLLIVLDIEPALAWILRNVLFYFNTFVIANVSLMSYVWAKPALTNVQQQGYLWKHQLLVECCLRYVLGFFVLVTVVADGSIHSGDGTPYRHKLVTFSIVWMIVHLTLAFFTIWLGLRLFDTPIFRFRKTWIRAARQHNWKLDVQGIWYLDESSGKGGSHVRSSKQKHMTQLDHDEDGGDVLLVGRRVYMNEGEDVDDAMFETNDNDDNDGDNENDKDNDVSDDDEHDNDKGGHNDDDDDDDDDDDNNIAQQRWTETVSIKGYDRRRHLQYRPRPGKSNEASMQSNHTNTYFESKSPAYVEGYRASRHAILFEDGDDEKHNAQMLRQGPMLPSHAFIRPLKTAMPPLTSLPPLHSKEQFEVTRSDAYFGAGQIMSAYSKQESIDSLMDADMNDSTDENEDDAENMGLLDTEELSTPKEHLPMHKKPLQVNTHANATTNTNGNGNVHSKLVTKEPAIDITNRTPEIGITVVVNVENVHTSTALVTVNPSNLALPSEMLTKHDNDENNRPSTTPHSLLSAATVTGVTLLPSNTKSGIEGETAFSQKRDNPQSIDLVECCNKSTTSLAAH